MSYEQHYVFGSAAYHHGILQDGDHGGLLPDCREGTFIVSRCTDFHEANGNEEIHAIKVVAGGNIVSVTCSRLSNTSQSSDAWLLDGRLMLETCKSLDEVVALLTWQPA